MPYTEASETVLLPDPAMEAVIMRKTWIALLALCLLLPAGAAATALEGLSLAELEALRAQTDERIQQLRLPDAAGYYQITDGEGHLREPEKHIGERVRLSGTLFSLRQGTAGEEAFLSLEGHPARVFLLRHQPEAGAPRLLPGDRVSAYGVFQGLRPLDAADPLASGTGLVEAEAVVRQPAPEGEALTAGSRLEPLPLGVKAVYAGSWWSHYASFEIELLSLSRGSAAQKQATRMSKYNITPPRTQEWYIVTLRVKALSAPGDRAPIQSEDFRFVSAQGQEYRHHFLINDTQGLRTLYVGGEQTATIACLIDKDDQPLIVFQAESLSPLWFDANQKAEAP